MMQATDFANRDDAAEFRPRRALTRCRSPMMKTWLRHVVAGGPGADYRAS
jgi:hypothetical protein